MVDQEKNNIIFVGNKKLHDYITAVVFQSNMGKNQQITIKSRGKFISKAVDLAEVIQKKFLKGQVKVSNIQINSEEFKSENRLIRVSTIEITLTKQ